MISGYQLPYKSEKLLKTERALSVQVRLTGIDDDAQCDRTKTVKNNGASVAYLFIMAAHAYARKAIPGASTL